MYSAKEVDVDIASKIPEPSGYKLLIKPLEVQEKTESGIYMPDALKQQNRQRLLLGLS